MKTLAIGSFFVLFAIIAGVSGMPAAFGDHPTATVSVPAGTGVAGCEQNNECYIPYDVSIDVGGEVTWMNDDTVPHTVTSGTIEVGVDGLFDSSLFMAGESFSFKFDDFEPGEYPYFCMVHPWMTGIVTVVGEEMEDDHMDGEMMDGEMMDGDATAMGMLSDGTPVKIWTSAPAAGEQMEISIEFEGSEHVNHDITVTQNGEVVLEDKGAHHHEGTGVHETAPLNSADPVEVMITFQGFGVDDPKTGPIGDEVVFTNVVPEFGTIAVMILAVAIVSIIAVSARSRISLVPRI